MFVTVRFTAPGECAGVVAVMVELFTTLTPIEALPPRVTVAPVAKFVPVIVTRVPPGVRPAFGETPVTVGAGAVRPAVSPPSHPEKLKRWV